MTAPNDEAVQRTVRQMFGAGSRENHEPKPWEKYATPQTPAPPPGFELVAPVPTADLPVRGPWEKYAAPSPGSIPAPPPGFELVTPGDRSAPSQADVPAVARPSAAGANIPKPYEPTIWDRVVEGAKTADRYAGQLATGVRKGATGLVGLPVDAAALLTNAGTWAINKATGADIPYATHPVGGGAFLDKLVTAPNRAMGFQDPVPQSAGERVAQRIGEELGAAAVPVGAGVQLGKQGVEAARELPALARMFAEPAAINPRQFVNREVAAATAAGTGAGTINELTGAGQAKAEGKPLTGLQAAGDIGGAVTGVGAYAIGGKVADVARTVIGAFKNSPDAVNAVARAVTVDEIARAAGLTPGKSGAIDTDPLARAVNNGTKVSDTIPGFQESLADRTKNPGLAAMEYSRQSGPNSGLHAARRAANTDAVDAALAVVEPQSAPGALRTNLEVERNRRLADVATLRANAADEADNLTRPLQPQGTPATRGGTVRTELEGARDAARERTAAAYDNAPSNQNFVDGSGLRASLDSVTRTLSETERGLVPAALIERVSRVGDPVNTGLLDATGQPITRDPQVLLKEATDLRSELQRLRAAAAADPRAERGGRNAARVLGRYEDVVDRFIQSQMTDSERANLIAARGVRRDEGDAFGRRGDPVAEILARNEGGIPKLRDERVAHLSTRDDVMARILEQADTPATREAIRHELLHRADLGTPEGIQRFTRDYASQIDRFPGLSDELSRAHTARRGEAAARSAEEGALRDIGPQGRGTVARYLQYGDENADKAMRAVIADKDPARAADDLLRFVNDDPKAVEGARKTLWGILQTDTRSHGSTTATIGGKQPYLPAALKRFTDDPATAAVAERLYRDNPEHWQRIKEISEAIQGVDVRNSAKAPNTSGTPQGLRGGFLPTGETIASRVFAVERGVVSPTFAIANVIGIMARKATRNANADAVSKTIDKALLDPDFAALLLKENNPANRAAMRRATRGWQGNEASTLLQALQPEDKDADTKDAAMRSR